MSVDDESSRRLSDQLQERLAQAAMFAPNPEVIDQEKRLRFVPSAYNFIRGKSIHVMPPRAVV